jgi:predicted kinase
MITPLQRPKIEILVGPIASGKSTYSKHRASQGAIIINDDAIVNAVHSNLYKLYHVSLKPLYKAVENTILQTALTLNRDVIIDRPNYSRAMRRRYIGIAKSLDAEIKIIVFPRSSLEVHVNRRMQSNSRGFSYEEWLEAARAHDAQYEEPSKLDEVDEIVLLDPKTIKALLND